MQTAKQVLGKTNAYVLSEGELAHLKKVELMMMDLKDACSFSHIPCSLAFGTLLGAARHQGFIPWDDDVDVWIPRHCFDKLIQTVSERYPNKYVFSGMGYDSWGDPFFGLKMMLKGTKAIEANTVGYPQERGIFIDIFPAFWVKGGKIRRNLVARKLCAWHHMNSLSAEYRFPPIKLLRNENKSISNYYKFRRMLGFFSQFGYKTRIKRINKITKTIPSGRYGEFYHHTDTKSGRLIEINFDGLIEAPFENATFPIIKNFKEVLRANYGNYMELPPIEKRERHSLTVLDFGDY